MNKAKIYQLAENKGLKIGFLITKSGVSRKSFYDYLNNRIDTPPDVLLRTANALNVSIDEVKA